MYGLNLKTIVLLGIILFAFAKHNKRGKVTKQTHKQNNKYVNNHIKRHLKESRTKFPRFIIPKPEQSSIQKQESKPERINIIKKSGSIKDNALPGAFGEDYSLTEFDESDDSSGSGSGSGEYEDIHPDIKQHFTSVTHDKKAENAAHFGNNVVLKPGINPTSAFLTEEPNHTGFKGSDKSIEKKKKKKNNKKKKTKNKKDKSNKKDKLINTKSANIRSLDKKKERSDHGKDLDIMTQIKNIEKKIDEVEKKNGKKYKKNKSKNLKEKVSSYIKQLESDITNEIGKDDEKKQQHSHLNKTHIKEDTVNNQKIHQTADHTVNITKEVDDGSGYEENHKEGEQKDDLPKVHTRVDVAQAGSPEGFECPWICFWTCHSYCPKECCNNPYHCPRQCKEFCTPYCNDKCCAPGTRRMPKLKINFQSIAETGKKDNTSLMILKNKTLEMQKAQNETNQIAKQLEALKQASFYAAQALGLPNSCPLFCPQICTPGLCKPECCSRSETYKLPRIIPNLPAAVKPQALPPPAAPVAQPQPQLQTAQVGRPAPLPASAPAAVQPASPATSNQISQVSAAAVQAMTQGATTTASAGPNTDPLNVVSSYTPLSPKEMSDAANMKGEKIGEFSVAQPNGQLQTFNIESGPISVLPEGPGATTNEQIKTEQTAYMAPENAPAPAPQAPQAPQVPQKANQRYDCPTPINCPEGATVDPDYCPPICRTACIEQCPNECCPNYGHSPEIKP